MRSARGASAAVFKMHQHWRAAIERIICQVEADGTVPNTVRPAAASMIVVGALWGAPTLLDADDAVFVDLCAELEAWLFRPYPECEDDV